MASFKRLVVETNKMNQKSKQMMQYVEDLQNEINQFKSIIEKINNAWEGDDSLVYINKMRDGVAFDLENLHDVLEKYNNFLNNAIRLYDVTENGFNTKSENYKKKEHFNE